MGTEPDELFSQVAPAILEDFCDHGRCVVKPDLRGHAAYVLENGDHPLHKAFGILPIHELWEAGVAIRE